MNTIAQVRTAVDRLAPLMLALFSSASIAFGLVWSLLAVIHPLG
ncbi:hypothetical protein ABQJ54_12395 [Rhodanobacter sp. Si-c]|uniref:Uncharacterized protein n=1 Tax=Rhodanobacter lycopersici TaxID=3162487 RepID=A0ABV3QFI4_9GAMM